MRRLVIFAMVILFSAPVLAQTPSKSDYYADGSIKAEYFVKADGLIDAKFYFASGELRETGQFLNYKRHGEWISYNRSGSVSATGFFLEGNKTGVWKFWDPNGNLSQEVDYSGNKPELLVHGNK